MTRGAKSKSKTFAKMWKNGEVQTSDIDKYVDIWHKGKDSRTLAQFLGMTRNEYASWVENSSSLDEILRRKRR